MKYNLYNIHTKGRLLKEVDRNKIAEYTGMHLNSVSKHAREGTIYKEKYKVVIVADKEKLTKDSKFMHEWEDTVAPFRNVEWVKSGGRQLKVKE